MIDIQITPAQFQYDVQSLVKEFYAKHDFKVNCDIAEAYRTVKVYYAESSINVKLYDEKSLGSNCKIIFEDEVSCDFSCRRETKNILKKVLYFILSKDTGNSLPWGNLTGIRPAKIPALLLEQGKSVCEVEQIMKETYLLSDEKMHLAIYIASRENKILSNINYKGGYSLYVGIPFCPTTCLYCSFTSYPISFYQEKTDAYVEALIKELKYLGESLRGRELNSIYIGGGTPTTLSAKQLERLVNAIRKHFDTAASKEFTVEAGRPDSITKEKLMVLKENGITRISINPQTMNQQTLDIIGRKHTVSQVKEAFSLARQCGFNNINMDFIVGLPDENEEKIKHSMEEVLKLKPDSLTVHALAIKRAARLNTEKENYINHVINNSTELMKVTEEYAEKLEMKPYYLYRQKNMAGNQENVGYSTVGKECLYNILMMGDRQDVFAAGAGATTKILSDDRLEAERIDNVKNVDQYIDRIDEMIDRKRNYFKN